MEISLCSKAKNVADPANDCQNYAKTFPNAQCVQDEEVTGTCKQQFPCLSVTKTDLKKDTIPQLIAQKESQQIQKHIIAQVQVLL